MTKITRIRQDIRKTEVNAQEVHTYSYTLLVKTTLSMNKNISGGFIFRWKICTRKIRFK